MSDSPRSSGPNYGGLFALSICIALTLILLLRGTNWPAAVAVCGLLAMVVGIAMSMLKKS